MRNALIVLLLVTLLAGIGLAQTPGRYSDIPYQLQTMEGRSWHSAPLGNTNTLFQQILDQAEHGLKSTVFLGISFRHEGSFSSNYSATTYTSQVALSSGTTTTAGTFATNPKTNRHANYQVCMIKRAVNYPAAIPPYYPWKEVLYLPFNKPFQFTTGNALLFELKNYDTTGNQTITRNVERTYPGYVDTLTAHTSGPYGWFGTECPAGQNQITVNTANLKVGGSWYSLLTSPSANNSTALSFLGFSNTKWLMLNLPLDLTPLGFTGCTLYTGINLSMTATWDATNTQYRANWAFPNDPNLAGLVFYNQWAVLTPTLPGGLGFSHCLNCFIAPATAPGKPLFAKYAYYTGATDPDTDPTLSGPWNAADCLRIYHP